MTAEAIDSAPSTATCKAKASSAAPIPRPCHALATASLASSVVGSGIFAGSPPRSGGNRGRERISLASPPAVADILPDAKPLASRALAAGRWRPFAVHASADHDAHDAMAPCAWHARHGAALPRTIQVVSGGYRGHSLPSPIGPLASIMWGWRTNRLMNRLFHSCGPASATMRRGRPRSFASVA